MTDIKKICLIRQDRPYWETIEKFLNGVNAELVTMSGDPSPDDILNHKPDLIILNARVHHGLTRPLRQIPIIVVKEGTPPVTMVRETAERNLLITGWPLERGQFLEITSRMLNIAPRRIFKTLIRIFVEGDDFGSLGQSRDFSLSGLAFKTEKSLSHGDKLIISFSIPEASTSLRLGAEVVRDTPDKEDGRSLYGARFTDLTPTNRNLLTSFILHG